MLGACWFRKQLAQWFADDIFIWNFAPATLVDWATTYPERGIITKSLWYPGETAYSTGYDPGIVFKTLDIGKEWTQRIQMPPKWGTGKNQAHLGLRLRGKGKVVNLRRKPDRAFVNFNLGMQKKKKRERQRDINKIWRLSFVLKRQCVKVLFANNMWNLECKKGR